MDSCSLFVLFFLKSDFIHHPIPPDLHIPALANIIDWAAQADVDGDDHRGDAAFFVDGGAGANADVTGEADEG